MRYCKKACGVPVVIGPNNVGPITTHGMGGYGLTPNVITQISTKVPMTSHFLCFVDSMSSPEQKIGFPNQNVQDPVMWTLTYLLQLEQEYLKLVADFNCDIKEFVTVQDPPVSVNLQYYQHTNGSCIRSVCCFVRLDID